jgi:hypothetical protein
MRVVVKCDRCKTKIGTLKEIRYPEDSFLWDKIDYDDFQPNEDYGGCSDDEELCCGCYEKCINHVVV